MSATGGRPIDALSVAAILAIVVVGLVVLADILVDGELEPAVLALFISVMSPLVPALLVRYGRSGNGNGK